MTFAMLRLHFAIAFIVSLSSLVFGQTQRTPFDVTSYKIDASIASSNQLKASADVTFMPLEDTRAISFELNGSLKIESVTKVSSISPSVSLPMPSVSPKPKTPVSTPKAPPAVITFIQDQVGVGDLGPSVKIDLGEMVAKGTSVTLRFKYAGALASPEGGPLLTKRLAYVSDNFGYLLYASRWFPFHDYAADKATSDITLTLPNGVLAAGYSEQLVLNSGGKFRFVQTRPALIGNFAFGKYINKTLRFGEFELQFFTKLGNDALVSNYGELIGRALDFYTKQYGSSDSGKKLIITQIDDESLDFYSAQGVVFIANRLFEQTKASTEDRILREVAYQWWGQTVGLKSFDDAWLSQGLAEFSSYELRESKFTGAALDNLNRELLEKSLTFEQTSSLARVTATLDDQSTAYQYIMFGKGAYIFRLLRDTLGKQKFSQLIRKYLETYRGKNASIDDFEKLASEVSGNNMRYFFARWVEGTGVPEFSVDYQIIRTRAGKFVTRGTVRQNYDNLRLPVELLLRAEGENETKLITVNIEDASEDFNIESNGKPLEVIIDPNFKILRISEDLKVSAIARRGIEQYKEGNYAEAQTQFEQALKLDRNNSWVYYHLGLIFLEQRNYDLAIDNFKAARNGNLQPSWLETWSSIKMGNAYDSKGDRNRAVSAYKQAEKSGDEYDNAQDAVKKYLANPFDPKDKQTTAGK
jgi:hypothetical protein